MNTACPTNQDPGEAIAYDITDWRRRLYRLMQHHDPFKRVQLTDSVILQTALSGRVRGGWSMNEIALTHTWTSKEYDNLLRLCAQLDHDLRVNIFNLLPENAEITHIHVPYDQAVLLVEYALTRNAYETGFEGYLESRRREGEYIHPEIDRQLRFYRSTITQSSDLLLLPARRRGSGTF